MPSHLTHVVFRSLIANEPLLYRGCCYRALRPRTIPQHGVRLPSQLQRRTFLNGLFKPKRKLKPVEVPEGLEKLSAVSLALKTSTRPPEPAEVADAMTVFFAKRRGTFENYHVVNAYNALKYLRENPRDDGRPWLNIKELFTIFDRLLIPHKRPEVVENAHLAFGRAILDEVTKMGVKKRKMLLGRHKVPSEVDLVFIEIKLLSYFGAATEARDMAASTVRYDPDAAPVERRISYDAWKDVLVGFIHEDNLDEILKTMDMISDLSIPYTSALQSNLVHYFADRKKDMERAKYWYSQPIVGLYANSPTKASGGTCAALLRVCASCGDLAFGQQVVASLLQDEMPPKSAWDAIFLWGVATGKGADEIGRMMDVLERRNDEARQKNPKLEIIRPDGNTINILVDYCMSKQDPYSAERFSVLAEKRGILPNDTTYSMQIKYRISVGDLDGARAAYFNLQGGFMGEEYSVAAINQLIQALCASKQHHFDELMAMVDDLHERKAHFAPETVAAVTLLHLRRGEIHDAMDLLQVHAHQYAPNQRSVIRNTLSGFILDPETSTADAWDGYQILRNVFVETPREDRVPIMNEFFARNRSDMACHVFFHMRNHLSPALAANRDVYIAAFTGFARCADAESLELAHNQLRLDLNVDTDTKLRNSLMLAYAAIRENRTALQLWREICESKEGPTYNSIAIAFRSCEGMHFGTQHTKSIWHRLKEQDVEIDKTIWTAYMSAIARNHNHDEAKNLIETVEEEYGFKLDLHILGSWFNCTASREKQTHVETWIKERYPEAWNEMEALGHWVTDNGFGYRQYNINRDLDP
ncbi:hypothetical protein BDW02DRAFT_603709 [Decorospora gaudefroyi]|uniref:Complex I intermediate-associated protein-like protein 84 n=1 Tax=Decorospora gaudefroyi TaxID=184978 RepID=A0A6A5JX14_9PLEO|nr:hypothetical protein BDW02DRAFT_603709 [Decorospora gaudefroyi]